MHYYTYSKCISWIKSTGLLHLIGSNPCSTPPIRKAPRRVLFLLAEMEGFEPPHALRRLADFESAPFSHLGTSPCATPLYQSSAKKSRFCRWFFCHFYHKLQLFANLAVAFAAVRTHTAAAILDPLLRIPKITAAVLPQRIQRTKTEQAVKILRCHCGMAGKIFTFPILHKITGHTITSWPHYTALQCIWQEKKQRSPKAAPKG